MSFGEKLNSYIKKIGCEAKELSKVAEISETDISRYRNDKRTSKLKEEKIIKIAKALATLSKEKNIKLKEEDIFNDLSSSIENIHIDIDSLISNLNTLINNLNITITKFSNGVGIDRALVSKIKNGKIEPSNPSDFIDKTAKFIAEEYTELEYKRIIADTIHVSIKSINNYYNSIYNYLKSSNKKTNYINSFIKSLDDFELSEYISAINFNHIKNINIPFFRMKEKTYYGIEKMREANTDFFKSCILTKQNNPIFMCSDMPISDLASDTNFDKTLLAIVAYGLKKGFHINIIHTINRPIKEMMIGLESWIPVYMTGLITSFYLDNYNDNIYHHSLFTSENAVLVGDCIGNNVAEGKYELITNKDALNYYKKRATNLLNFAKPLMKVYTKNNEEEFYKYIDTIKSIKSKYRRNLTSLPINTITDELLISILKDNKVTKKDIERIIKNVQIERKILKDKVIEDTFSIIGKEDFENNKPKLDLSFSFYDKEIYYTYEQYKKHLNLTLKCEKNNKNYKIITNKTKTFKNIDLLIIENNLVIISKRINPIIHFVITEEKLRTAIENFTPFY